MGEDANDIKAKAEQESAMDVATEASTVSANGGQVRIGVVGAGANKFSELGKARALGIIRDLAGEGVTFVSGHSPLGGVDWWTEEMAFATDCKMVVFHPEQRRWEGGYRDRNLKIAQYSDECHVIVVSDYPEGFAEKQYNFCYHCKGRGAEHKKSGGCWTAWKFEEFHPGKKAVWHIVSNV